MTTIRGRLATSSPTPKRADMRPCSRCGNVAERRTTTILCTDCRCTMTKQERAAWVGR